MKSEWAAYIPDDGCWDIPGEWTNKKDARKAFLKMLELTRVPAGTKIYRKEG